MFPIDIKIVVGLLTFDPRAAAAKVTGLQIEYRHPTRRSQSPKAIVTAGTLTAGDVDLAGYTVTEAKQGARAIDFSSFSDDRIPSGCSSLTLSGLRKK